MTDYSRNIYAESSDGRASLKNLLREVIESFLNSLIEQEFNNVMGYGKNDAAGRSKLDTDNYRNGTYTRELLSTCGNLSLTIPRDRKGEFRQELIPQYARRTDDLEDTVIKLYSYGITNRETAELLFSLYGKRYSASTISNITEAAKEVIDKFKTRHLNRRYVALYADATWLNLRRDSVEKEALHAIVGITDEGKKELLAYSVFPTESASNYEQMLLDIRGRGAEEVLLIVSDGLKGFRDAAKRVFPQARTQRCWVHLLRNAGFLVRRSDRARLIEMLKGVFRQPDRETAERTLRNALGLYGRLYKKLYTLFADRTDLWTLYEFPEPIRRSIYSANIVENIHRQLKRRTKRKEQFPNEDSLERFVFSFAIDLNKRSGDRIQPGFLQCRKELDDMFEETYPKNR
ncbi:MAG: IS256 family transposase [Abditibacteriota bacterium]|nr:IS256 family transposase [Abditibacteriota bacterium]